MSEAAPHGHFLLVTVTLPNGTKISGFVPKTKMILGGDAS